MRINYQKIIKFYEKTLDIKRLESALLKLGFEKVSCGTFCDVFRFKDHRVVLKYIRDKNRALPTLNGRDIKIKEHFVGYEMLSLDSVVGVQKFVEEFYILKNEDKLKVKFLTKFNKKYDVHLGNVGLLNGKPVIFDF